MLTPQNDAIVKPFAGLYLRTQGQMRFWGWSSRGWATLHSTVAKSPAQNLADWLREAHAQLDDPTPSETPVPATQERATQKSPGNQRKLQFVCTRHMIGLLIR